MTGAEALSLWTGRMGLRKAKASRCSCWLKGHRCGFLSSSRDRKSWCRPPAIEHASVWGLGAPPDFDDLRVLVSQPALVEVDAVALEVWCARRDIAYWERPELSWRRPGETTLQAFVLRDAADKLVRRPSCPGCRATDRWTSRTCCGIGDLAGWWDSRNVAAVLMGEA